MNITLPLPYDADSDAAGVIALGEATRVADSEEFAGAVLEAPTLLGIVDVTPGVVTIGLSVTVRNPDKDAFLRAVRKAIKSAFDAARQADSSVDFRPPVIVPSAEPAG